jgi:hypothetical protein
VVDICRESNSYSIPRSSYHHVLIIYYRIYAIGINNRQQVNKQIYSISIDTIQDL